MVKKRRKKGNSKKHLSNKNINDRNNKIVYIAVGIFALITVIFLYNYFNPPGNNGGETTLDDFAICLKANDVKMYGTEWCGYCKKQKEIFGDSFQYVDYIDCDKNREICTAEEIGGYPTWKVKGSKYSGVQSLEKLSQLSGCVLENAG